MQLHPGAILSKRFRDVAHRKNFEAGRRVEKKMEFKAKFLDFVVNSSTTNEDEPEHVWKQILVHIIETASGLPDDWPLGLGSEFIDNLVRIRKDHPRSEVERDLETFFSDMAPENHNVTIRWLEVLNKLAKSHLEELEYDSVCADLNDKCLKYSDLLNAYKLSENDPKIPLAKDLHPLLIKQAEAALAEYEGLLEAHTKRRFAFYFTLIQFYVRLAPRSRKVTMLDSTLFTKESKSKKTKGNKLTILINVFKLLGIPKSQRQMETLESKLKRTFEVKMEERISEDLPGRDPWKI